jgi:wyosine [tRNA(Phe)-imidazoG37] synthetase (radical SAM superfamily)
MSPSDPRHVYGPVRSRRLGRSLGVDLVPFKTCSYDCIYCQLGRTTDKTIARKEYVPLDQVLEEVARKLAAEPAPDYIGLAGSGEPTLHSGIGKLITALKGITTVPVAVLTNGSLLWMPEVRTDLAQADLVLPSLDAADPGLFQRVNRPHSALSFESVQRGLVEFTRGFRGSVWLEILLLAGITDSDQHVAQLAEVARRIHPERIQLNTVSRPPVEKHARAVSARQLEQLRELFPSPADLIITEGGLHDPDQRLDRTTADAEILALLKRRPCTVEGISAGLGLHAADVVKRLDRLRRLGAVKPLSRNQTTYYITLPRTSW